MDTPDETPKSNHPLDKEENKVLLWDKIDWTKMLEYCCRFELISKEQEADLQKVVLAPEICCAVVTKAVKEQGEDGYQKIRKALAVPVEGLSHMKNHKMVFDTLPAELPGESPPPEPDEAALQRNWLARHFKSLGNNKIDQSSIHFSSMLVDVAKYMELEMEATGIFCLQSFKMIDGSPLLSGRYIHEADNCDNLFITMEHNKMLHSRDGHLMEALCLELDRPDVLRYTSEFLSQIDMPPAEADTNFKMYLRDRFIMSTVVFRKKSATFDDILRVKSIVSEFYKVEKHVFQFRGWMKGTLDSVIVYWQFPISYLDHLEKLIVSTAEDMIHCQIDRVEFHLKPGSYKELTVFCLREVSSANRARRWEEVRRKREDRERKDRDPSAGSGAGAADSAGSKEVEKSNKTDSASSDGGMQTRSKTRTSSKSTEEAVLLNKNNSSFKRDFNNSHLDQQQEQKGDKKFPGKSTKKLKLACVGNSFIEHLSCV